MENKRNPDDVANLGRQMSDTSEACYYASWLIGTEHFVPELCHRAIESNEKQCWGHGEITPEFAKELQKIADRIGHWVNWNEETLSYIEFDPFPIPNQIIESLNSEQEK